MTSVLDTTIFKKDDKKSIDVQKVVIKLWQNRMDAEKISSLADILCQFVDEKDTFTDIEYYLPQIAHLIIHAEQNVNTRSLETLAMVISQTSMHSALQLSFMLVAAMEDYQPELAKNQKNPSANPYYFNRCARLMQDVEKAVIFGWHGKDEEAGLKTSRSDSTADEASVQRKAALAQAIAQEKPQTYDRVLNGMLFFKRIERKSLLHSKQWHQRYFVVDQRVLLCFSEPHSVAPKRAISLQNCRVVISETHPKYGDTCFEVVNDSSGVRYLLRAVDPASRAKWVEFLTREITGAPHMGSVDRASTAVPDSPMSSTTGSAAQVNTTQKDQQIQALSDCDMTPAQRRRFRYFLQMRVFITNLTNICERLRFKERDVRKYFLKRDMAKLAIPPFAYLPLCNSVDDYQVILRALPKECHAFSTKARVPALMLFETERHPRQTDLASFLNFEVEHFDDAVLFQSDENLVFSAAGDVPPSNAESKEGNAGSHGEDAVATAAKETLSSPFTYAHDHSQKHNASTKLSAWLPEGTGQERLREMGYTNIPKANPPATSAVDVEIEIVSEADSQRLPLEGVLGETFAGKAHRLREHSGYGHLPGWSIGGLIAKSNDDVRQEVFVIQLMKYFQRSFQEAQLPVWMHTYKIVSTSKSTGLIELIPNSISLDGLKKSEGYPGSLRAWYEQKFGSPDSVGFRAALQNYIASQAAYSIVAYLLAIKDRHNGNIMIDKDGHIIHIDFGFVFGLAPGKQFSMERAPWKLNAEFVDVLGGKDSDGFRDYRQRCLQAFTVARQHAAAVTSLMEIMQAHSNYPAFRYNPNAIKDFRARLFLDRPDEDLPKIIDSLIARSYRHSGTDLYDQFQLATNGIAV